MAPAHALPIVEILLSHPVRGNCPKIDLVVDVRFHPVRLRPDISPDAARPERIGMARQQDNHHRNGDPKPNRPEQCEISQGSDLSHARNIGTGSAFVKSFARVPRPGMPHLIRTNIPGVRGQRPRPLLLRKAPSC